MCPCRDYITLNTTKEEGHQCYLAHSSQSHHLQRMDSAWAHWSAPWEGTILLVRIADGKKCLLCDAYNLVEWCIHTIYACTCAYVCVSLRKYANVRRQQKIQVLDIWVDIDDDLLIDIYNIWWVCTCMHSYFLWPAYTRYTYHTFVLVACVEAELAWGMVARMQRTGAFLRDDRVRLLNDIT